MGNIIKADKRFRYEKAQLDLILLSTYDVIATSSAWDGPLSDGDGPNYDESGWT